MAKQREEDEEKVKEQQAQRNRLSRGKRKADDPQKTKDDQNRWQEKHRRVINEIDRLREFKKATMYNAIFICICCHQECSSQMFASITKSLKMKSMKESQDIQRPA